MSALHPFAGSREMQGPMLYYRFEMTRNRVWTSLSLASVLLMVAASAGGIFLRSTYVLETASWAAQAVGQDAANLFLVAPAMLVSLHFARRGSARGALVALGLLIYTVYSYILYAFFVHFGPWFPVYVAVLGLSAYALFGALLSIDRDEVVRLLGANNKAGLAGWLLLAFSLLFAFRWLDQIFTALAEGNAPQAIAEIGTFVNPIHVLDLAILLPGMIVTSLALRRRRPLGLLFAAPLLTFAAAMGVAILCMFRAQQLRGISIQTAQIVIVSTVVLLSLFGLASFLRRVK